MSDDIAGIAILGLYFAMAIAILGSIIYGLLRSFFAGKLNMKADRTELARGETIRVEIDVPKNARRLDVALRAEEMYETSGKHSRIYTENVYQDSRPATGSLASGKSVHTFEIPKSAPPSIGLYQDILGYVRKVGLRWYVYAKADLPNAFDKEGRLELKVK